MRVTINPTLDIATLTWIGNDGVYEHDGPVVRFGGPSREAKENQTAQIAFYRETTRQQGLVFGQQQEILKAIQDVTMPILNLGPNQYGFTPEEDALLRQQIIDESASAEQNAVASTRLSIQQKSGGAQVLPTGADATLEEQAHLLGEQGKAEQLSRQKLIGYEAGKARYAQALAALSGNAGLLSPTSYTTAATGAGKEATGAVRAVQEQRSGLLGKILGGVIGAGTSFLTGGLSNITGGGSFLKPASQPCWLAALVFGEDFETGPRINLVRRWLVEVYEPRGVISRLLMLAYSYFGQFVSHTPGAKMLFTPLFNRILREAERYALPS